MPRTLIVSDLHLGTRLHRDVLRLPAALDALLEAVAAADRLVLLGDTVELTEARPREAMEVAVPVLREIARRVGPDGEVILVPGNHDRPLVREWLRHNATALPVDGIVPVHASAALERVAEALGPARVDLRYPGVWLGNATYATHGHYLDKHLLPVSPFGLFRSLGRHPRTATVADYEHGPHVTGVESLLTSFLPRRVAALIDDLVGGLRGVAMAAIPSVTRLPLVRRVGGPVGARALSFQMRRSAIPALLHVLRRMEVDAHTIVFGHVHRLGPLGGDDPAPWGANGRPRVLNTGSWIWEPLLLYRASPPHPYWPGGAVVIEDGEPRAVGLLDGLTASELRGPD